MAGAYKLEIQESEEQVKVFYKLVSQNAMAFQQDQKRFDVELKQNLQHSFQPLYFLDRAKF